MKKITAFIICLIALAMNVSAGQYIIPESVKGGTPGVDNFKWSDYRPMIQGFLNALSDTKADKSNTYTKDEIDALIAGGTSATEEVYYISTLSGSDTNDGTITQPWKTISKANSTLVAGDTVYLRAGTYGETIRPDNSGAVGMYITYAVYGSESVIITDVESGVDLSERSYVNVDGFRILDVRDHWVEFAPDGTHNVIQNCYMEEAGNYTGIALSRNDGGGANYNKILNNTFVSVCGPKSIIGIWSSGHNLIEGNSFSGGPHDAIIMHNLVAGSCDYNIIRNNYFQNKWHHNLAINYADYILVEDNVIVDAGMDALLNVCGTVEDQNMAPQEHKGLMANTRFSILRGNTIVNNGYGIGLTSNSTTTFDDNRIYNNTLNKCYEGFRVGAKEALTPITSIIKNNIIFNSVNYEIRNYGEDGPLFNEYVNNCILGASMQYGSSSTVIGALSVDPLFVNESGRDFNLQPGSPMINAGAWLATTTSAGSGKIISVDDARYFMDGWGMIEGDLIQLEGQSTSARITAVDYENNIISVDTTLTWASDLGVSLPYGGTAPNIGAY